MNLEDEWTILRNDINHWPSFFSCDEDGNQHSVDERFSTNHPLRELELPTHTGPSSSPAEQKMTVFANFPKSIAMHFSSPRAADFAASAEHQETSCSSSSPGNCTTLQERLDLEMSVLRRQEAVLKLQEEYYTLKIKMMKKPIEPPLSKDWSNCKERSVASVCFLWNVFVNNPLFCCEFVLLF